MKRTESLTYTNENLQSIEFGCTHASQIWLAGADGLDQLTSTVSTAGGIDQYGELVTHRKLNVRPVTIFGKIRSNSDTNKSDIIKVFDPTQTGKLIYHDTSRNIYRYLDVVIEQTPQFSASVYPEFDIQLLAAYPLWKNGTGNKSQAALALSGSALTATINNAGDLPSGIEIVCNFTGIVTTITFSNTFIRSGLSITETLTINHNFDAGDRLTLSTGYDNCRATVINGAQEINLFPFVTPGSKWWELQKGNNTISVTASTISRVSGNVLYDVVYLGAHR